jgi:hypothetical protein
MKLIHIYSYDHDVAVINFNESELSKKSIKELVDYVEKQHLGEYEEFNELHESKFCINVFEIEANPITLPLMKTVIKEQKDLNPKEKWILF